MLTSFMVRGCSTGLRHRAQRITHHRRSNDPAPANGSRLTAMLFVRMFKLIRMVKRGDKLPAEFRQEWLERNRELRKTADKLVAGVVADGKLLRDEAAHDGGAALFFPPEKETRAAEATRRAQDGLRGGVEG